MQGRGLLGIPSAALVCPLCHAPLLTPVVWNVSWDICVLRGRWMGGKVVSEASSLMGLGSGGPRGSLTVPLSFASLSPCLGFDITPNYVDSSPTGIVVSPWCSCRGSGNMEEECEKFLRDFTENPCLRESCHVLRSQQPPPTPPIPGGPGALPGHSLLTLAVASDACRASPAGGLPAETMGFVLLEIHPGAVWRPLEALHLCRVKAEGFWSVILTVSARFLQTQPWGEVLASVTFPFIRKDPMYKR